MMNRRHQRSVVRRFTCLLAVLGGDFRLFLLYAICIRAGFYHYAAHSDSVNAAAAC